MSVRIKIEGSELGDLAQEIEDSIDFRGRTGQRIASILRADTLRQFQAGGIPSWAPLQPRTIEQKARMGYPRLTRGGLVPQRMIQRGSFGPGNVLMRTGALLSSWSDSDDPHHFEEVERDSVSIGSSLPYAGTHQEGYRGMLFGNPTIQGVIPARPIRITAEARRQITETLEES